MRYKDITEALISDLTHVGDWSKNSSFRHEQDRKLLTSEKAIKKITQQWAKVNEDFNVYLVNSPEANRHTEVGEVTPAWLADNMPKTLPFLDIKDNAINLIFTNNKGAERVPMTGWIMAHRFGHAVSRFGYSSGGRMTRQIYAFQEARDALLQASSTALTAYGYGGVPTSDRGHDSYRKLDQNNRTMVNFYQTIGTMRSARTGEIRNEFEFLLELLAQYMLTGSIKFNPLQRSFKNGRSHAYIRGDYSLEE